MNRTAILIALCAVLLLNTGLAREAKADFRIGVLAKRGAAKTMQKWGATATYLTNKTGEKCSVIPLKFTAIEPAVTGKKIDFLLSNPSFFVEMQKKHNIRAIATLINSRNGKAVEKFGGVLFVRHDSPIKTLADVKGKKFMCVKRSSLGGAHMAWRLLMENNVDLEKDTSIFIEGGKHDNVVLAVKNGSVDVGTVRSDTLERMQDEGKIKMSDFKILNQVQDDFPFAHSTRLYPEWPMAALDSTDSVLADRVAAALKELTASDPAAIAAKIFGWTNPADYTPVADCLRAIQYGAFAKE